MDYTKSFRVVAVSTNSNSFGLKQFVAVAKDGDAFKLCANYLNVPKQGEDINLPFHFNTQGQPVYSFPKYELPERLEQCPAKIVKKLYK